MRDYSKFSPKFWTGETGGLLRELGRDAQVVGSYLFTCPMANMIGLYYLNLATLIDEVGHLDREGALKVLRSLSEGGYATFDERSKTVFVVEMAKHQVGEHLTKRDNRHKALVKELEQYRKSPFFNAFLDRYAEAFELEGVRRNGENGKSLGRGSEAPSKPGTGTGEGAGEGERAGTGTGTGSTGPVDNSGGAAHTNETKPEDFSGRISPPEDPQSRRAGKGERKNGDFEAINEAVCKVLAAGLCKPEETSRIAQLAWVSESQAVIAVRQLRDRGRLPTAGAAA